MTCGPEDGLSELRQMLDRVEALQAVPLHEGLLRRLLPGALTDSATVYFHTPGFRGFESSEIRACGKHSWPAVSITGGDCELQCDHCRAAVLAPMTAARSPDALWRVVNGLVEQGGRGMLLTGGSNRRNEVCYQPFLGAIARIKRSFPDFRIAAHTGLVDEDAALALEQAGVDVAMMDVIGAERTLRRVYHLKRGVADFEASLAALAQTAMRVVPHVIIGLHYGHMLGEWQALRMIARHRCDAVVLVAAMPYHASPRRPFARPDPHLAGAFFLDARATLPDTPLLLGCARPAGLARRQIDSYAVLAGLSGVAHPAEGVVELAARLGRRVRVSSACCATFLLADTDLEDRHLLDLNLDAVLAHEAAARSRARPVRIPVAAVRA